MNRSGLTPVIGLLAALALAGCGGGSGAAPASGSGGMTTGAGSGGQGGAGSGGAAGGSGGAAPGDAAGSGGGSGSGLDAAGGAPTDAGGSGGGPADASGDAPAARFVCPAGAFETPRAGTARAICAGVARYNWSEGPTWSAARKAFFYSNFPIGTYQTGDILRYTPDTGRCEVFIEGVGCNGLAASNDGNLLATCQGNRSLMKYDLTTKQGTVVVSMVEGRMLDSPNDVVQHSNGSIYFTNPTYELGGRPMGLGNALLRVDPAGAVSVLARGSVNGVALSPDEKRLYVVGQGLWDLDAAGVPSNRRAFTLGSDGIAVDCAGNVYNNGGGVISPAGQNLGNIPASTNMAFGGPDGKTLLVVANQGARLIDMNIPGLP